MTLLKLLALLLSLSSALSAQTDHLGLPACCGPGLELADRTFFSLCHDSSRKVALWVGYQLTPQHLSRLASRPTHFRHDRELSGPSAFDADYKNSGYFRGHLAPAADFAWSGSAIRATFLLSNAVPVNPHLNAGRWAQIEAAVRRIAATSGAVYVFTGPLFESPEAEFVGAGRVAVPRHLFKVILAVEEGRKTMYAAIVPNAGVWEPLDSFATTVAEVERRTGLDFFSALEDTEEHRLESSRQLLPARSRN